MNIDTHIPSYTNITHWEKREFYNTKGSREKIIVVDKNEELFYFKGSKETIFGEVRYPTEFWSEIASSKIGKFLGFNLLDYNIAYDENDTQKIGCLSKSMIVEGEETLSEAVSYLTGFDPSYNPETDKKKYTFQFILEALKSQGLDKFIADLVEVIIFDSIVSNSDRHQENWGLIYKRKFTVVNDIEDSEVIPDQSLLRRILIGLFGSKFESKDKTLVYNPPQLELHIQFSPIYDSGCSLGREREGDALTLLLSKDENLVKYINKGQSEIHWNGKKLDHFTLVKYLHEIYPAVVEKVLKRVKERYNKEAIQEIINALDNNLPSNIEVSYHLPAERKKLMQKLVILRLDKLLSLI